MVWYGTRLSFFGEFSWILVVKKCSLNVVWYARTFFPYNSLHHRWQTPAALHNHTEYQQTTCAMQFSPCLFLQGFLSCFPRCRKRHVHTIMLAKVFPRLIGTVKFVCTLCEFWWWKVQLEYGYIWIVFFITHSPLTPAAPHNCTKYKRRTCAMQFSPCLFLHVFCPVFQHAERDTCIRLCWPKFSRGWLVR